MLASVPTQKRPRPRGPWSLRPWGCLAMAVAVVEGCADKPPARTSRVPVTIAVAEQRSMPFALLSTGTVEPIETAAVGSQVGGTVTRIAFREGAEVRSGQVLIELDPRPFQAALGQASAALAKDRALAEAARLDAERSQRLFEQNLVAKAEWDQKRSAAEALAATVQADSAATATARLELHYASIRGAS